MQRKFPGEPIATFEDLRSSSKRSRTPLACISCRGRKIKCDGRKPVCGPCDKRGKGLFDCAYAVPANSARIQSEQEYVASLQRQVRELQQALSGYENQRTSPDSGNAAQDASPQPPAPDNNTSWNEQRSVLVDIENEGYAPSLSATSAEPILNKSVDVSREPERAQQYLWQNSRPTGSPLATGEPSHIGAMGAAISIQGSPPNPGSREFYGPSSVMSLVQDASRSNVHSRGRRVGQHHDPSHRAEIARRSIDGSTGKNVSWMLEARYSLPPREVADQLLGLFYSNVHIFYPWTHAPSVWEAYELLWTRRDERSHASQCGPDIGLGGIRCEQPVFFCALNAMFALGCEFSESPAEEKEAASAVFFDRMKALLHLELFERGSLSHVQALLLAGHSLLCSQYPSRCWNIVGLACRMAIGLGLQSEKLSERRSYTETEITRRVWHGCLQMDCTVSMTLGRPPSLSEVYDVPLPTPIDDDYLSLEDVECHQPENIISQNAFNVQNLKLVQPLATILNTIYHPSFKGRHSHGTQARTMPIPHDDFTTIASIDARLDIFENALPLDLQWRRDQSYREAPGLIGRILKRQSNVLHARFLHLKVLLYRPSLSRYCALARSSFSRLGSPDPSETNLNRPPETALVTSLRLQCAVACVNATCGLIRSVEKAMKEGATGAWWFAMFYLMTCGVILIIAENTKSLANHLDQQELRDAWETCIGILGHMGESHSRVPGYLQTLLNLRDKSTAPSRAEMRYQGNMRPPEVELEDAPVQERAAESGEGFRSRRSADQVADQPIAILHEPRSNVQDGNLGPPMAQWDHPMQWASMHNIYEPNAMPVVDNWEVELGDIMFPPDVLGWLDGDFLSSANPK